MGDRGEGLFAEEEEEVMRRGAFSPQCSPPGDADRDRPLEEDRGKLSL